MNTPIRTLAAAIGFSCLACSPVFAEGGRHLEIIGGGGYNVWDTDRNLDDSEFYGGGLGFALNRRWTLEAWFTDGDTEWDRSGPSPDIDTEEYRLDALYHLTEQGGWRPYIVAGVGDMNFENDSTGREVDETRINLGLGVKRMLGRHFNIRADLRAFNSLDEEQTDLGAQMAISWLIGDTSDPTPMDSDGDGVPDEADACPNTPPGAPVDATGCPLDSDGDGVFDYMDQCPGTDPRLKVDSVGCPMKLTETVSLEVDVEFELNSDVVRPQYYDEIRKVADFMQQYEGVIVEVQGHTDSSGAAAYNQQLSERRAASVAKILVEQHGIESSRVHSVGYGETMPEFDNSTSEGRAANRRVIAEIKAKIETMEER